MKSFSTPLIVALFATLVSGCGEGGKAKESAVATADVTSNLDTISDDFVPNSLEAGSGMAGLLLKGQEQGGNPCADTDNLYDCQPVLLRLYLDLAQSFVDMTQQVIEEIGTELGQIEDGTSGTIEIESETVHYVKTSSNEFSILLETDAPRRLL